MRTILPLIFTLSLAAQPPQGGRGGFGPQSPEMREGTRLDLEGKSAEAKAAFRKAIDSSANPAAKANAQRAMAMSYAFDGDCKNTGRYEQMVIDYWKTQESAQPGNAFYQEGEMANEAARVCIDAGDLDAAEQWYRKGREMGLKEPNISPGRKDLWEYRTEHALARISARRGRKAEAEKHVAAAKSILDDMQKVDEGLYNQQKVFFPYLTGYVALYTGDPKKALADFQQGNTNDAFMQCLIGMAYEKLGDNGQAMEWYKKASNVSGHNPPAAFAKPFTRKKLGGGVAQIPEVSGKPVEQATLRFIDIKEGDGAPAGWGKEYTVHYTGWLRDGTQFDSSVGREPLKFVQGRRQVIAGLDVGFEGMKVGGKRRIFIPYQLAYGEQQRGKIPPKSELIFDVELLDVKDASKLAPGGELLLGFNGAADHAVALLKAFPEDKLDWRPGPGVRSVREVCIHIALGNRLLLHIADGPTKDALIAEIEGNAKREGEKLTKAELIRMVEESLAAAREVMESATAGSLSRDADFFGNATTRRGILTIADTHLAEHVGQLIAYARMNGIVPPWSR